ncbi:TPA: conjugative transfer relaxase/helicase TraI [Citrobacter koseri]|nr:conjugative transfer relaxase/helicase TraI [Citrobacter koseri]
MLSLSTISGDAGYYSGAENYEIIHDDKGQWLGDGAERLNLTGAINPAELDNILKGHLPDGTRITRQKDGAESNRPGLDLTFGAPKSLSILALMGGDKRLIAAFKESVTETLAQVEKSVNCRVTEQGDTRIKETGNGIFAMFTHDTNRNGEMHLHSHALLLNATHDGEKWRALGSDLHNRNGIREQLYDLQIAYGQMQREILRPKIEALGYTTVNSGKHGMFELAEVPRDVIEMYSTRTTEINEAVGRDASAKSREIAALDTREKKEFVDGQTRLAEWQEKLSGHTFDPVQTVDKAMMVSTTGHVLDDPEHAPDRSKPQISVEERLAEIQEAITKTVAALSDRAVQFSHAQVMSHAAKLLPAAPDTLELLRGGINHAIDAGQLIPMDKEKGLFTSHIHLLDELSVKQLAGEHMSTGKVAISQGESTPEHTGVYAQLANDRNPVAIVEGRGGAAVQGERVSQLAEMVSSQGRSPLIISPTAKAKTYLQKDAGITAPVAQRTALTGDMALNGLSTVIVQQAETLGLKQSLLLLEQANATGAQVIFMDSGQSKGTGYALGVLEAEGVKRHQFNDAPRPTVEIETATDKNERYHQIATAYLDSIASGENTRVQVTGEKEQSQLTGLIREQMRHRGQLTGDTYKIETLTPVFLNRHNRQSRETYRAGMVMERFNQEEKRMERYTIDRVGEENNTLRLVDADGNKQPLRLRDVGEQWNLFKPGSVEVATGDTLRILGREARGQLKAGETVTVTGTDKNGRLQLSHTGNLDAEKASRKPVAVDFAQPLKLTHGYVESLGASVQDNARVLAAITTRELREETINRVAASGNRITLFSAVDKQRAATRLEKMTGVKLVSEQLQNATGIEGAGAASTGARENAMTDAQKAVNIALSEVQNHKVAFQTAEILTTAIKVNPHVPPAALHNEVRRQLNDGDLIPVEGKGGLVVPRVMYEMEKSILRDIAEGKNAVSPLMASVPPTVLEGLTEGQKSATRLILESTDRFTGVQGYAGVGKTTQFRAVASAISMIPEAQRPEIIGLAPTHRAVGEMQNAGVKAQTLDSFLFEHATQLQNGETPDYSNKIFLVDEASMTGNKKLSETYSMIKTAGGRAITSGDDAQLKAIDTGQPFRLAQQRSAMDFAIMNEIVRQKPELREAVYAMIEGNARAALSKIEQHLPDYVPRHADAYIPQSSVMEISPKNDDEVKALTEAGKPVNVVEAIARDYSGRTENARDNTLIVAHINDDRRAINRAIHEQLLKRAEIRNPAMVQFFEPVRVTDSDARTLNAWTENIGNVAVLNRDYWTITGTDQKAGVAMLKNADGKELLISPFDNSTQQPQFYHSRLVQIAEGDRLRFNRTDTERGYINNTLMNVEKIDGQRLTLRDIESGSLRTVDLSQNEEKHLDLGYAVTAYGAQGASERFVITLEGVSGSRKAMASPDAAYVSLSRHKEHVQVYTDNREGWLKALDEHKDAETAHDVLHAADDRMSRRADAILSISRPLNSVAHGRNILFRLEQDADKTLGRFVPGTSRHPSASLAFPAWNEYGHKTGVLMMQLSKNGHSTETLEIVGASDARFVGIQQSSNGNVMMADSLPDAFRMATANPDTGVMLRFSGDGVPHNPGKITGGGQLVTPVLPELSEAALKETQKTPAELLKEASQQSKDEQKPDLVVPVDSLPEAIKRIGEKTETEQDKTANLAQKALDIYKGSESVNHSVSHNEIAEIKKPDHLRNIERDITKSFED